MEVVGGWQRVGGGRGGDGEGEGEETAVALQGG